MDKTMFAIYLIEDEQGFIVVKSDHYGPGFNSYTLGMQLLENLNDASVVHPEALRVETLDYLPRAQ